MKVKIKTNAKELTEHIFGWNSDIDFIVGKIVEARKAAYNTETIYVVGYNDSSYWFPEEAISLNIKPLKLSDVKRKQIPDYNQHLINDALKEFSTVSELIKYLSRPRVKVNEKSYLYGKEMQS